MSRRKRPGKAAPEGGNYVDRVLDLAGKHDLRGRVTVAHVYHDPTCPALKGGTCNCQPDIRLSICESAETVVRKITEAESEAERNGERGQG